MASIYDLKPKFQAFLRPVILALHRAGVTPNMVTVAALAGSFVVGGLSLKAMVDPAWLLLLPVWFFLRMALNAIDGVLARDFKMKSHLGAVLNETGDVLSDAALFLPLAAVRPDAGWPVVLFTFAAALSEFCGVLGQALGAKRGYAGPMGKSDRAFFVGGLVLVSAFWPAVFLYWKWFFWILFALAVWTCHNRIQSTLKELGHG